MSNREMIISWSSVETNTCQCDDGGMFRDGVVESHSSKFRFEATARKPDTRSTGIAMGQGFEFLGFGKDRSVGHRLEQSIQMGVSVI